MMANKQDTYDSIIRIHILRSDSLDTCTCGGLYCSAEPLPMGFTLPRTRLTFKHLRPLSCQRLRSPATLTTWVRLLYLRLTDPLEFRDAILTWIHILIYTLHATMRSPHETHGITPITPNSYFIPYPPPLAWNIQFSCNLSTNQPNKIHVLFMPTYKFLVHKIQTTTYTYSHALGFGRKG